MDGYCWTLTGENSIKKRDSAKKRRKARKGVRTYGEMPRKALHLPLSSSFYIRLTGKLRKAAETRHLTVGWNSCCV
jgi:hypothetical protein